MITVRFSTGFSVQYNTANFLLRGENYALLYTNSTKEEFIAQIPNECIIEFVTPCRTYNPVAPDSDRVVASIDLLGKEIRALRRKIAKDKQ